MVFSGVITLICKHVYVCKNMFKIHFSFFTYLIEVLHDAVKIMDSLSKEIEKL